MSLEWAKVGLFKTFDQDEQVAEVHRVRTSQPIQDFGDHWMTWHWNNIPMCNYQRQTLVRDGKNRLEILYWTQDSIQFSRHAVERIHQRGSDLSNYQDNLGIENFSQYLDPLLTLYQTEDHIIGRSDIVVPYRNGALLGDLTHSDPVFGIRANRIGLFVTHEGVHFPKKRLTFRAHTYIDKSLIRPEQQSVIDLIKQGRMGIAAEAMKMIPMNEFRTVELEAA